MSPVAATPQRKFVIFYRDLPGLEFKLAIAEALQ